MDRVYEMWPFLSENSAQSVLDLALDRTTEHLKQAIDTIVSKQVSAQPVEAANPPQAPATGGAALADTPALDTRMSEWQRQINDKMEAMAASIAAVQREMAQFSKFSSNLVLRLDDAVAKTRESLASAHAHGGPAHDPLVEARRDRDMGIIKSSLESIHQALERAGISTV
ncbi:MAG: hypothetical protein EPN79_11220 [Burkholderiaceae bacterium]|nr:MAG: hypothetical protein EPN79_11220 [Burkholderiaceae bacterium]TBR76747.1 MAG: hypothetical protein EPN64_05855 [Burkholderiaceae bacterium]